MSADDKKFSGAPFGTQKARFEVAGIHPKSKPPGTITQVCYDRRSMLSLNRSLGPGKYNVDTGDFSKKNVEKRAKGPGWLQAYETSQVAKLPHLLYREEWEKKRLQKCLLGPGTYDIPDSFKELMCKPGSIHGVCETREQRFADSGKSLVPGPGTYGKGGIPHSLLEEKELKSASTVGLLDAGASGKRQLPEVGSALCPGQYNSKSFTDEMAERVISKRGPYDLFTGDRNKPIITGHLAAPKLSKLGPGEYEIKSFLDEWKGEHKMRYGKFDEVERFPGVPSERLCCTTLSQWPRRPDEPGPGSYNPLEVSGTQPHHRPPFGSSAQRMDRKARTFFLGNTNPVGPGRYNINITQAKKTENGCSSAFNSNTRRWDSKRDKYLTERIRSKGVPVKERLFLVAVES